jgi:hypothetical protein
LQVPDLIRYYMNLSRNKSVLTNPSWISAVVHDKEADLNDSQAELDTNLVNKAKKSISEEELTPEDKASLSFIYKVLKKLLPMPFNAWLIYVQTFMLFPGVAFVK